MAGKMGRPPKYAMQKSVLVELGRLTRESPKVLVERLRSAFPSLPWPSGQLVYHWWRQAGLRRVGLRSPPTVGVLRVQVGWAMVPSVGRLMEVALAFEPCFGTLWVSIRKSFDPEGESEDLEAFIRRSLRTLPLSIQQHITQISIVVPHSKGDGNIDFQDESAPYWYQCWRANKILFGNR